MERPNKNLSTDLRTIGGNSTYPIPHDLVAEIFKRFPVKTLARFLCISKESAAIIRNRDFLRLYLMKSSNPPRSLIFTFKGTCSAKHFFFSTSDPDDNYGEEDESSSSVATYIMKCNSQPYTTVAPSVHGLIIYGPPSKLVVYNPSSKRSITLPRIDSQRVDMHHFLCYDPIDGDYKVLCMIEGPHDNKGCGLAQELRVLTLGNGNSWRLIQDFPLHFLEPGNSFDMCIDGVLYYVALPDHEVKSHGVMSFDVRSEKFDLVKGPEISKGSYVKLTSYEGKLAALFTGASNLRIHMWVLEDAAKHVWSKKFDVYPTIDVADFEPFCAVDGGEIVLAPEFVRGKPFYVVYYDPSEDSVSQFYIEGLAELKDPHWDKDSVNRIISIFSGQVENPMFL